MIFLAPIENTDMKAHLHKHMLFPLFFLSRTPRHADHSRAVDVANRLRVSTIWNSPSDKMLPPMIRPRLNPAPLFLAAGPPQQFCSNAAVAEALSTYKGWEIHRHEGA
jgi:hypothetical protein